MLLALLALGTACVPAERGRTLQLVAFGTVVEIRMFGVSRDAANAAGEALQAEYRRIDADWYPWPKPGQAPPGELRRLNQAIAARQPFTVSADLAALIRRAAQLEQASSGRFNPAIGAATELWGFADATTLPASPPDPALLAALPLAQMTTRQLHWTGDTLRSDSSAVMLDLGGIAKGAILELSAASLREHGVSNAIVDIGGDLIVLGKVGKRAARIGIRSPLSDGVVGWLEVADGETVVTSGDYERYFEYGGRRYQHILDPRTGIPVSHTRSVTVVDRDPLLADAAATALVVAGPAEFAAVCRELQVQQALLISAAGDLRLTAGMRKRVNWSERPD
ncbi:MAG: FAD:protein FMN transferase [Gammaproteobacteria bacterium]|nr:MAG: FAD:protein FMN transferase [Gammaproteobacteria bacterium]